MGIEKSPLLNTTRRAHLLYQGMCQGLDVFSVKVGCRLVQGQNATVETECFCQSKANDERSKHLRERKKHKNLQLSKEDLHITCF